MIQCHGSASPHGVEGEARRFALGSPPQPPKLAPFNRFRVRPQTPGRLNIFWLALLVFLDTIVRDSERWNEKRRACSSPRGDENEKRFWGSGWGVDDPSISSAKPGIRRC